MMHRAYGWNPLWLPARFVMWLISGYQKWLSPYKGFCCAHRALHGGESCSQHVKRHVSENGLRGCWRAARERFRECRKASWELRRRAALVLAMGEPPTPPHAGSADNEIHVADLVAPGDAAVAAEFQGDARKPQASNEEDGDDNKRKRHGCFQWADGFVIPLDCCCSSGGCELGGGLLEGLSCASACG